MRLDTEPVAPQSQSNVAQRDKRNPALHPSLIGGTCISKSFLKVPFVLTHAALEPEDVKHGECRGCQGLKGDCQASHEDEVCEIRRIADVSIKFHVENAIRWRIQLWAAAEAVSGMTAERTTSNTVDI